MQVSSLEIFGQLSKFAHANREYLARIQLADSTAAKMPRIYTMMSKLYTISVLPFCWARMHRIYCQHF